MNLTPQESLELVKPLLWCGFILTGISLAANNWAWIQKKAEDMDNGDPPPL